MVTITGMGKRLFHFMVGRKPLMCSVKVFLAYLQYISEGEEMPCGGLVYSSLKIHALGERFKKFLANNYIVSHNVD